MVHIVVIIFGASVFTFLSPCAAKNLTTCFQLEIFSFIFVCAETQFLQQLQSSERNQLIKLCRYLSNNENVTFFEVFTFVFFKPSEGRTEILISNFLLNASLVQPQMVPFKHRLVNSEMWLIKKIVLKAVRRTCARIKIPVFILSGCPHVFK